MRSGSRVRALWAAITLVVVAAGARAEAFRPADPGLVLLRLPATAGRERQVPRSLTEALQLAALRIAEGRRTGQPRGFGTAESILESWRTRAATNVQWHVLAADIRQYRHEYRPALALLARAVILEPGNVRARLMRASILQTQGEFAAARRDCSALLACGESALGTACLAQVAGLTGELQRAHGLLRQQLRNAEPLELPVRLWLLGALADMAERRGDAIEAERWLTEALRLQPADRYFSLALADLLLAQRRARDAENLLRTVPVSSGVLLRLAEAREQRAENAEPLQALLRQELARARERGEQADLRELVRLRRLEHRPCDALQAARANWAVQREPADVRLLLGALRECPDPGTGQEIARWLAATRYEDSRVTALLDVLGRS